MRVRKKIDYFTEYDIILLTVSPAARGTAESVGSSIRVTAKWLCGNA